LFVCLLKMHPDNFEPDLGVTLDVEKINFYMTAICNAITQGKRIDKKSCVKIAQFSKKLEECILATNNRNKQLFMEVVILLCVSMRLPELRNEFNRFKVGSALSDLAQIYAEIPDKARKRTYKVPTYANASIHMQVTREMVTEALHKLAFTMLKDECAVGIIVCYMNNYHIKTIPREVDVTFPSLNLLKPVLEGMISVVIFSVTKDVWCFRYLINASVQIPAWTVSLLSKDEFSSHVATKVIKDPLRSTQFIGGRFRCRFRNDPVVVLSNNRIANFIKVVFTLIETIRDESLVCITDKIMQTDYYDTHQKGERIKVPPVFFIDCEKLDYGFVYKGTFYQYTNIMNCISAWLHIVKNDQRYELHDEVCSLYSIAKCKNYDDLQYEGTNTYRRFLRRQEKR